MARIRQYFAPIEKISADRQGWSAYERATRVDDDLYRESSRDIEGVGGIYRSLIKDQAWPMDIYKLAAEGHRFSGGMPRGRVEEPRPPKPGKPDPTVFYQDPENNGALTPVQASTLNPGDVAYWDQSGTKPVRGFVPTVQSHQQISRGVAAIGRLAAAYSAVEPAAWSNAGNQPQEGETDIDASTGLPTNPYAPLPKSVQQQDAAVYDQNLGRYVYPSEKGLYRAVTTTQGQAQLAAQRQGADQKYFYQQQSRQYSQDRMRNWYATQNQMNPDTPMSPPPAPPNPYAPTNTGSPGYVPQPGDSTGAYAPIPPSDSNSNDQSGLP